MPRAELIEQLQRYCLRHANESATVERMIELLDTQVRCFERDCWHPGHITGSAWVVDWTGDRVLLTHHRKLNRWLQLGGHADGDEDPLRVALREGEEESGLALDPLFETIFDVDIHAIPARGTDPQHLHYDVRYAFTVRGSEAFVVGDESHELAWIRIDRMDQVTEEVSMLRMAERWASRRPLRPGERKG